MPTGGLREGAPGAAQPESANAKQDIALDCEQKGVRPRTRAVADRRLTGTRSAQRTTAGESRYGQGMEDSLTRYGARLQMLLLVSTLASFVSWLAGLGCEATGVAHWLQPRRSTRKLYSTMRIGREALVRRWPLEPVSR